MSEVVAVLIGVVLATAGQWFVSPIVERRVRARERWETDVLRLGELISEELPRVRHEAFLSFASWYSIRDRIAAEGISIEPDSELAKRRRTIDERARSATNAFSNLVRVRMQWLIKRVLVGAPDPGRLEMSWMRYSVYVLGVVPSHTWEEGEEERDKLIDRWDEEFHERKALFEIVEAMADSIGPPRAVRYRLRRLWRQVRSRFKGRDKNASSA